MIAAAIIAEIRRKERPVNLHRHFPNVVTFYRPLRPGDRIKDAQLRVFEVAKVRSVLTMAGEPRPLFIAIHEKDADGRMETLFTSLHDEPQSTWVDPEGT